MQQNQQAEPRPEPAALQTDWSTSLLILRQECAEDYLGNDHFKEMRANEQRMTSEAYAVPNLYRRPQAWPTNPFTKDA